MKAKIFTSYYYKILNREKNPDDVYIQVSSSLGYYAYHDVNGIMLDTLIDLNWGSCLGNEWDTSKEYFENIPSFAVGSFAELLKSYENGENVFILCHENIRSKYTAADVKKYNGKVKAGEYKVCHRTWLAEKLNEEYGFEISEFE